MPAINPYLNRQPISHPSEFFGRTEDVRWLLAHILHPSAPQCCAVTGLRRIGKSSLLRFLEHEEGARARFPELFAGHERLLLVYTDLSRVTAGDEEDGEALALGTLRYLTRALARQARRRLPPDLVGQLPEPDSTATWQVAQEALDDTLFLLDDHGFRVIFLLDEMDVAAGWHPRLAQVLRALVMEHAVAYVTGSLEPLYELLEGGRSSPLYNLFSTRPLGLLEPGEARLLLDEPARQQGVTWAESLSDQVIEATGGHPDLLKRAASHLWDLSVRGEAPDLHTVEEALRPDAEALFTSIWDHLGATERHALAALAMGQVSGTDGAPVLPALQQRAILAETEQGARLFGHLFARWVRGRKEGVALGSEPRVEGRWLVIGDERTQLTPTEVKLARALLRRRGQTVPREELQRLIWNDDLADNSKALDTTVQRLRGKLEADRNNPQWLLTVRGEGYMFK